MGGVGGRERAKGSREGKGSGTLRGRGGNRGNSSSNHSTGGTGLGPPNLLTTTPHQNKILPAPLVPTQTPAGGGGGGVARGQGGGKGWHKASVSGCLPLAAPIGLSPLLILTLCGPERVLVVSTEPPDDLSCLTTPGVGRPGDGLLPVPLTRCIQMHTPSLGGEGGQLSPVPQAPRREQGGQRWWWFGVGGGGQLRPIRPTPTGGVGGGR